jgi:hypothetical protein
MKKNWSMPHLLWIKKKQKSFNIPASSPSEQDNFSLHPSNFSFHLTPAHLNLSSMHNHRILQPVVPANLLTPRTSGKPQGLLRRSLKIIPFLVLSMMIGWTGKVNAQTGSTTTPAQNPAPPELTAALTQIDAAATKGDLAAVMQYYSPSFTNSDGLTYASLEQTLTELWKRYPNLTYQTQLSSWNADGNAIVVETTTTITGTHLNGSRDMNLSATITSRQRFENQKIVQQEVLAEHSQLTSGEKPPTLQVNLPEQVTPGQQFDFDAIVTEPLDKRLLLGAAMEEPIEVNNYLNAAPINLDLLSAGGVFKTGRAPTTPGNRWLSAVVVRDDGIATVTQRLRVVDRSSTSNKSK